MTFENAAITSQSDVSACEVHRVSRYEMVALARKILEEKHRLTLCNGCRAALIQQGRADD